MKLKKKIDSETGIKKQLAKEIINKIKYTMLSNSTQNGATVLDLATNIQLIRMYFGLYGNESEISSLLDEYLKTPNMPERLNTFKNDDSNTTKPTAMDIFKSLAFSNKNGLRQTKPEIDYHKWRKNKISELQKRHWLKKVEPQNGYVTIIYEENNKEKVASFSLEEAEEMIIGNKSFNSSQNGKINCKSITGIIFGTGIRKIPDRMCYHWENLKYCVLPEDVEEIGELAFAYSLCCTDFNLPPNLQVIGNKAFSSTVLGDILFPNSLLRIDNNAYEGSKVGRIYFNHGLKYIGEGAFLNCGIKPDEDSNQIIIDIPPTVEEIKDKAFALNIDTRDREICEFDKYSSTSTIILHDGVRSIGCSAFSNRNVESVMMASSVEKIYDSAFSENHLLERIDLPEGLKYIGNWAFYCTHISSVIIPSSVVAIGRGSFETAYMESITSKRISDSDST
ncbi:MAG: leucine-rich repeat domain-containing protein [Clostridia bacterium]|nr:leucine-rich repeat domain-containing protein [Clostridia bacterium]